MTTPSTAGTVKVDLRNPGQLLAAIPHLLGFRPADSVLVIGHRGETGNRIGNVLRADLPNPDEDVALAVRLRTPLLYDDSVGVTIAIVGGGHDGENATGPPRRQLVDTITDAFAEANLCVMHALWVPEIQAGARWQCYEDSTCTGRLPDPNSTVLAAVSAHAGLITYGSREAMERQLDPVDPAVLARRSALLDEIADSRPDGPGQYPDDCPGPADPVECGRAVVRAALARAHRGDFEFCDREVVELALALERTEIRDACLATALPPAGPRAVTAERLWLALTRELPAPERAQAATLLGYSAYVRGEGALAGMAVARAREADPGHVLAQLLAQALDHALPPETLAKLGASTETDPLWEPGGP